MSKFTHFMKFFDGLDQIEGDLQNPEFLQEGF